MGRKLLAAFMAVTILFSLCPTALANDSPRQTAFFTSQTHTELDYSEMAYTRINAKSVLAEMEELRALLDDSENAAAAEERFDMLTTRYQEAQTMSVLAELEACRNAADPQAAKELELSRTACTAIADALFQLMRDILRSPCGDFLEDRLGPSAAAYYRIYTPLPAKQQSLSQQETALISEYRRISAEPCTVEYFGRDWDMQSLNQAFHQEEAIDAATYAEIYKMLAQEMNDRLGGLYLRMVQLRRNIAALYGCETYGDYAYRMLYRRDYSPQEIETFRQDVQEYIAPLNTALHALPYLKNDVCYDDYSGEIALDLMAPYIGQMSSELLESFNYMREHHLYDTAEGETKTDTGFTTVLTLYGAPFLFNAPAHDLFDFVTTVHEFGHYNNAYWSPWGWLSPAKSHDAMEVHSQGMELLFSHYYPQIFGRDGQDVTDYQITSLVEAICQGAYYDELQQFVYGTKNVTLQQINDKARQLSVAYGFAEEDSPMADVYGLSWVQVSHNFTQPFYYISYGVSAAGAFAFWLEAQRDYPAAVDSYLAYTALDASYDFRESFSAVGMTSPLADGYLKKLAETLRQTLRVDQRLEALRNATAFTDVSSNSWYAPYVLALAELGCVKGDESGAFRPGDSAAWDTAMGALLALTGQEPELEDSRTISRLEFCQMVVEVLGIPAAEGPSPFSDTDDSAAAALAELGVISGYDGGAFRPDSALTRAEMCAILYKAAEAVSLFETKDAAEDMEDTEAAADAAA